MTWPFAPLVPRRYGALLIDPPWAYAMRAPSGHERSPEAHYQTMTIGELSRLPVRELMAPDCLVWMWSTWPHLPKAMDLMRAWGLTYKTGGAWHKLTAAGGSAMGTGFLLRSASEPFLIGTLGAPKIQSRAIRNVLVSEVDDVTWPSAIEAVRREHSRKPPQARQALEALMPHVRRAELFAREPWPGADVWGDQLGLFGGDAA